MTNTIMLPLDENGHFSLDTLHDPAEKVIRLRLHAEITSDGHFARNLSALLTITSGLRTYHLEQSGYHFEATIPAKRGKTKLTITIGGHVFAHITLDASGLAFYNHRKLVVFETRMIACGTGNGAPYALPDLHNLRTPIADLHTHSSGQISARGLIDVALHKSGEPFLYPTALLDDLGIRYPQDAIKKGLRILFPPLIHLEMEDSPKMENRVPLNMLEPSELHKLEMALSAPPDQQLTFGELELSVYRLRYPMTKSDELQAGMYRKVAEEYAAQGIRYAEISTTSILNPDALKELHDILPDIEAQTGVQIRVLAAIPRNFYSQQITDAIEKLKILAKSPYIVGVDILGYESNKTVHLESFIRELFIWASENQPEFIIRIHAGENAKNVNNVKEFLYIAQEYGIRARIGHAIYGMDAETVALAKELARDGLLIIEFNPDSNLALNNIDTAAEVPLPQCLKEGIPAIISSDSGGIYRTSARQLAIAALCSGIKPADLEAVNQIEQRHIDTQQIIFAKKTADFPADFFRKLHLPKPTFTLTIKRRKTKKKQEKEALLHTTLEQKNIIYNKFRVDDTVTGKEPIFIAGASGTNWLKISPEDKREISIAMRLLTESVCPHKAFFFTGRTKNEGVGRELNRAIVLEKEKGHAFVFMAMLVEAQNIVKTVTMNALTHVRLMDGTFLHLPYEMIHYTKERHGAALFIGGGTFTRDFILLAGRHGIPYGLMQGPVGASTDKARVMPKDHSFSGAQGLIRYLHRVKPAIFREGFDIGNVSKAYQTAKAAQEAYEASVPPFLDLG